MPVEWWNDCPNVPWLPDLPGCIHDVDIDIDKGIGICIGIDIDRYRYMHSLNIYVNSLSIYAFIVSWGDLCQRSVYGIKETWQL